MRYSPQNPGRATRRPSGAASAARNTSRRGFTLIEAAMVTVIIGIGVVGMLELLAAGTMSNTKGTELTTAINLANNVREISLGLAFADPERPDVWNTKTGNAKEATVAAYRDIKDLDGENWCPPLDVRRQAIMGYDTWRQKIKVETVDQNNVGGIALPPDPKMPTARITVTIQRGSDPAKARDVYVMSWLAVAPKAN
jgi:type II secretory pathway pseudopilin PulG